jgi:subtilisin family serine protease
VRHGAKVISMSIGYSTPSGAVRQALQEAYAHGVVVVASAGNSGAPAGASDGGQAPVSFPADYPGVISVGAVDMKGAVASFSSDNVSVRVAAPGVAVPAQGRDGQYWLVSGTSPACAIVSGVAALIRARYPHLPPALVDQAITGTAQHAPPGGYDDRVGFGTVDAAAALATAGRLSRESAASHGAGVTAHFGGGPAAVPPVPVPPRGKTALAGYAVLALCCLGVAGFAAAGLRRTRRSRGTRGVARGSRGTAGSRPLPGA